MVWIAVEFDQVYVLQCVDLYGFPRAAVVRDQGWTRMFVVVIRLSMSHLTLLSLTFSDIRSVDLGFVVRVLECRVGLVVVS